MTDNLEQENFIPNFEEIKKLTIKLAEILHIENKLLKQYRITKLNEMSKDKEEIILYLNKTKKFIIDNPGITQRENRNIIEELIHHSKEIDLLTEENFNLITKAVIVNKKLIDILKEEVLKTTFENIGYTHNGLLKNNNQANIMPPLTLTDLV